MSEDAAKYRAPNDHAIIVGINRYRLKDDIPELLGAVNDATLFHEWTISPNGGGLNPKNSHLLVSPKEPGPFEPFRDDIEDEIFEFYNRSYGTGGRVGRRLYLFMAGHGVAPADGDDCSLVLGNSPLNPYRVLTGRLTAERVFRQPLFEEVVLFMACCRDVSGAGSHTGLPPAGESLPNARYFHGLAAKWKKRALEKQLPHPFDAQKEPLWQSVFTHSLLLGLSSAVDSAGRITALSVRDFVKKQVLNLVPQDQKFAPPFFLDEDTPAIVFREAEAVAAAHGGAASPRVESPSALAINSTPAPALIPVDVALGDPAAVLSVLDGADLSPINVQPEPIGDGKYRIHLPPGLYAFNAGPGPSVPVRVLGEALNVNL
ncbi:hypothetical protein AB7645_09150 [Bradyrhizobium sp. 956_D2_N1_5]|jgi:hypothetical protein|uniref:hypothetical protein n=1 Tax=unclassified Bradyrhizobium TaxID=2631580 RepID=UPI003F23FD53